MRVRTSLLGGDAVVVLDVALPEVVGLGLGAAVQRRPLWLVLEQPHRLCILQPRLSASSPGSTQQQQQQEEEDTHVPCIRREAMIYASWHDHQIILIELNPHPVVLLATHVEEAAAVDDVANLLVLVQVLVEKALNLCLVGVAHAARRDGDLVAVLVAARGGDGVDRGRIWVVVVQDAEVGEVGG